MNEEYDNLEDKSWIKLPRNFVNWQWYKDPKVTHLYLHLLLNTNEVDTTICDLTIKRGEILVSLSQLAQQTGLSLQSIRTCLNKLKKSNEIEYKKFGRNRIIAIVGFNKYKPIGLTETKPNWIKLYRKITIWELYKNSDVLHLYVHIVLRSSLVTLPNGNYKVCYEYSLLGLSIDTGLSCHRVTVYLKELESMGMIFCESLPNYYIYKITIYNCGFFQVLKYYDGI